jgi:acyl carrier protein
MTDQEVIKKINTSLAEEFEFSLEDMKPETALFEEMGLDSLDVVDLVVLLETAFGMKIREEEAIRKIRTLGDIHDFVIGKKRQMENA